MLTFPSAGWYRYWPPPSPHTSSIPFHSVPGNTDCACSAPSGFRGHSPATGVDRGWCRQGRLLRFSGVSEVLALYLGSATNQLCTSGGHILSGSHKAASKPESLSRISLTSGCLTAVPIDKLFLPQSPARGDSMFFLSSRTGLSFPHSWYRWVSSHMLQSAILSAMPVPILLSHQEYPPVLSLLLHPKTESTPR